MTRAGSRIVLLGGILSACSDPVTLQQAMSDRNRMLCERAFHCMAEFSSTIADFPTLFGADESACNDRITKLIGLYETAEKNGTVVVAIDKYVTCTQKIDQIFSGQACDMFWQTLESDDLPVPPECEMAIVGQIPDGGSCTLNEECMGQNSLCSVKFQCESITTPRLRPGMMDAAWLLRKNG